MILFVDTPERVARSARALRPLIERVIVAEKPAYATYELVFATGATPARATGRKGVSR